MKKEVIDLLEKRIAELQFEPNEISQGMTGSFLSFQMYLGTAELLSEEDFYNKTYEPYLYSRHSEILGEVNNIPKEKLTFDYNDHEVKIDWSTTHIIDK